MSMHFRDLAEQAIADGAISANEILALRRAGWTDGKIGAEEAEAIFVINDSFVDATNEWREFFIEAIGEFIVNTLEPKGYVTDEQAEWLIAKISHDGKVQNFTELELLVRVLERSTSTPKRLRDYALDQIERAVLADEGPAAHHEGHAGPSGVSEPETRLLRRFIFASGGDRPAAVGKAEAEMLFRIKDATMGLVNVPEWKQLFVQGVGNYLMGFTSHSGVSRERAAELEAFMKDSGSSVGGFFGRMAKSTVKENFYGIVGEVFGKKDADPSVDALADAAEKVDTTEQMWLEDRIDGNEQVDEYDLALLYFLEEESGYKR